MPAKMRASLTSSSAAVKLVNERITPGILSESTENAVLLPKRCDSTTAAEPLTVEWPDGYSG